MEVVFRLCCRSVENTHTVCALIVDVVSWDETLYSLHTWPSAELLSLDTICFHIFLVNQNLKSHILSTRGKHVPCGNHLLGSLSLVCSIQYSILGVNQSKVNCFDVEGTSGLTFSQVILL